MPIPTHAPRSLTVLTAVALGAVIGLGGLALGIAVATPQIDAQPLPAPTVTQPANSACADATAQLAGWARDAAANADTLTTLWAGGMEYSDSIRVDNVAPLSARLEYITATYVAECEK